MKPSFSYEKTVLPIELATGRVRPREMRSPTPRRAISDSETSASSKYRHSSARRVSSVRSTDGVRSRPSFAALSICSAAHLPPERLSRWVPDSTCTPAWISSLMCDSLKQVLPMPAEGVTSLPYGDASVPSPVSYTHLTLPTSDL